MITNGQYSVVIKASGASRLSALPLVSIRRFPLMVTRWLQLLRAFTFGAQFPEWEERDIGQGLSPWHLSFFREKYLSQDSLSRRMPLPPIPA